MVQTTFSERLAEAMGHAGLKQVDLVRIAAASGVRLGKSQVSQYVSGKTQPRPDTLAFLASALEVDEAWLRGEAEEAGLQASVRESKGEGAMRTFSKSTKLDHVSYDVRGPVLDEAMRMEEAGMHILKLNIGNPAPFGFRAPDEVVQDMASQLVDCEGYSDSRGLFAARKAIMQYDQIKGIPNVTMGDIYTGNGVSDLINLIMQAMVDTGDEILVPSPDYPLWTACVSLAGGRAVHYICDEQAGWMPDIADIRSKVTSATKAIVIINPNNPTGALYPKEVLPLVIVDGNGTDIIEGRESTVIGVRYENMLFGTWYHGGYNENETYPSSKPQADNLVWTLTTVEPFALTANAVGGEFNGSAAQMKLTLNTDDTITISSVPGAKYEVSQDSAEPSRFVRSKLLQDRKIILNYTYDPGTGMVHAHDTLYFRNRIRDGVNEWQDENSANYD